MTDSEVRVCELSPEQRSEFSSRLFIPAVSVSYLPVDDAELEEKEGVISTPSITIVSNSKVLRLLDDKPLEDVEKVLDRVIKRVHKDPLDFHVSDFSFDNTGSGILVSAIADDRTRDNIRGLVRVAHSWLDIIPPRNKKKFGLNLGVFKSELEAAKFAAHVGRLYNRSLKPDHQPLITFGPLQR